MSFVLSPYLIMDRLVLEPTMVFTVNSFGVIYGIFSYVLSSFIEIASYGLRISLEILFQISDLLLIEFMISSSVVWIPE